MANNYSVEKKSDNSIFDFNGKEKEALNLIKKGTIEVANSSVDSLHTIVGDDNIEDAQTFDNTIKGGIGGGVAGAMLGGLLGLATGPGLVAGLVIGGIIGRKRKHK